MYNELKKRIQFERCEEEDSILTILKLNNKNIN